MINTFSLNDAFIKINNNKTNKPNSNHIICNVYMKNVLPVQPESERRREEEIETVRLDE